MRLPYGYLEEDCDGIDPRNCMSPQSTPQFHHQLQSWCHLINPQPKWKTENQLRKSLNVSFYIVFKEFLQVEHQIWLFFLNVKFSTQLLKFFHFVHSQIFIQSSFNLLFKFFNHLTLFSFCEMIRVFITLFLIWEEKATPNCTTFSQEVVTSKGDYI